MLHYKTLPMTDDVCTCTYVYKGNVRNPLTKISVCPAVSDFLQSSYGKCNAEPEHHFHQIVGNHYDNTTNQAIPWHSDKSAEGLTWLHKAVEQGLTAGGEDRGVLTFRRIAHHYDGSVGLTRCLSLPAAATPPCMPEGCSRATQPRLNTLDALS